MLMDLLMVKHEANIDNALTFWFIYASETRAFVQGQTGIIDAIQTIQV